MSMIAQLRLGWRHIWRGFAFLGAHRRLWPWAIIPWLTQLLVLGTLIALFVAYSDTLFAWATPFLPAVEAAIPDIWWHRVLWGLYWLATAIVRLIFYILVPLLLLLVTFVIGLIMAGPFNDILSEKTEVILTGREDPAFSLQLLWHSITRSIAVECQKALIFLGIPIVLLVFHLVPLVGSLVYVLLTGIFEMWAAGFAFIDFPQGRRLVTFSERCAFARDYKWSLLAFGTIFWIPGLMILCAPPLVVGGTMMYVELHDRRRSSVARRPS